MGLENILREEILSVNRGVIKKRRRLSELLEDPVIRDGKREVHLSEECLGLIAEKCNLPLDEILLPITFFIPAGLSEGYVQTIEDARVLEAMGLTVRERNHLFWVKKYEIRSIVAKYPGCFQSIIVP